LKISDLAPAFGAKKKEKRIGHGPGSGHGKTSTKGHKGQGARSGGTKRPGFEGGQQPLTRRIPKRGFTHVRAIEYQVINLNRLNRLENALPVTPESLRAIGMIRKNGVHLAILGGGEITKALTVRAHRFTDAAVKKIEAAGGRVERIA